MRKRIEEWINWVLYDELIASKINAPKHLYFSVSCLFASIIIPSECFDVKARNKVFCGLCVTHKVCSFTYIFGIFCLIILDKILCFIYYM